MELNRVCEMSLICTSCTALFAGASLRQDTARPKDAHAVRAGRTKAAAVCREFTDTTLPIQYLVQPDGHNSYRALIQSTSNIITRRTKVITDTRNYTLENQLGEQYIVHCKHIYQARIVD